MSVWLYCNHNRNNQTWIHIVFVLGTFYRRQNMHHGSVSSSTSSRHTAIVFDTNESMWDREFRISNMTQLYIVVVCYMAIPFRPAETHCCVSQIAAARTRTPSTHAWQKWIADGQKYKQYGYLRLSSTFFGDTPMDILDVDAMRPAASATTTTRVIRAASQPHEHPYMSLLLLPRSPIVAFHSGIHQPVHTSSHPQTINCENII